VRDRGPGSRATIAVETGLTKSTVSSLVGVLIDLGLLREATGHADPRRRPSRSPARAAGRQRGRLGLEVNVDYRARWPRT
jgi:hypothetical protein